MPGGSAVQLGAVAVACILVGCDRPPTCAELARAQRWEPAITRCRAAFARNHDPDDGLRLVVALERRQRIEEAVPIAEQLRTGGRPADGAYYLGVAAMKAEQFDRAEPWLHQAIDGYRAAGDDHRVAEAMHQLAGVHVARGAYRAAAAVLTDGLPSARRSGDPRLVGFFELARADLLRRTGDVTGAEQALERAVDTLQADPRDRAWAQLKLGILHLENERLAAARVPLEWVVREAPEQKDLVEAAHLNLAWMAGQAGDIADAVAHLTAVARDQAPTSTLVSLAFGEATVQTLRGQLEAADAILAGIAPAALGDDWSWVVPLHRGRLALRRGDPDLAVATLGQAVAAIEARRRAAGAAPMYLDAHREPYYELFALHARAGRWDDALAQLVALDAGDLLDASGGGRLRWGWGGGPQRSQPAGPPLAPVALAARVAALRASSRTADLVIALVAGDQLWRVVVRGGEVTGAPVARRDEVEALIDRIIVDPGDPATAAQLGALVLPPGDRRGPLYLAPLGELGRIPLAALRHHGRRIVELRPLIRLVSLAVPPAVATGAAAGVVLGDPTGDLPRADAEARSAAAHLGVAPRLGAAATADHLLAANGRVVHVASHAGLDDRGLYLRLADRVVYGEEIAATRWSAGLVVLASCGSAAARDPQGRGSLGSAFVRGGARAVLGSLWSVEDAATERLLARFYAAGGAHAPAAALATAQRELAGSMPARQWAAFVVIAALPVR